MIFSTQKLKGNQMRYHGLILFSMFFIPHASNAMEIVKKNKNKKPHDTNYWGDPIIIQFILTQRICDANKLPPEITKQIKHYNAALKSNTFRSRPEFLAQWNNFDIPIIYSYHLTSEQMSLLNRLLTSDIYYVSQRREFYYCVKSKKEYKLFLTLPEKVRYQLSLSPQSAIIIQTELVQPATLDQRINKSQTILIEKNLCERLKGAATHDPTVAGIHWTYYKEKPMLPKDKEKKL